MGCVTPESDEAIVGNSTSIASGVKEAPFVSKEIQEEGLTSWIRENLANGSKIAKDSSTTTKLFVEKDDKTYVGDNYIRAATFRKALNLSKIKNKPSIN